MKKINQSSSIFIALIIVAFYGCQKNPVDNFKIHVSPALFEYTAAIRIIDAADSTVPPNLKIVLDPANEGYLYDILGKNTLKITETGFLQVGLSPSIKPGADSPVEIHFQLEADNYISESYSLVFHLGELSVNKTYTLMNKSNLPRGVSYTEVSAQVTNGAITQDINIKLGGGEGGSALKSASANPNTVNNITIKAGTKFYHWVWDLSITGWNKYVKTEIIDSGQLKCNAYFYLSTPGILCYNGFQDGSVVDESGISKTIPANSALCGVGGWYFYFTLNGKYVWPENDGLSGGIKGATVQISIPKWGFNLKTSNLYKVGDVINIYHYKWNSDLQLGKGGYIFELLSSETLSETSDIDPNYFKLKSFDINDLNCLMIGEIFPIVIYDKNPVVRLQGDNTPPSWENPWVDVQQNLYKIYKIDEYKSPLYYYFGQYRSSINTPCDWPAYSVFIPGTYSKFVTYPVSHRVNNTVYTYVEQKELIGDNFIVGQGQPNPFDLTISETFERVNIDVSVKCGNTVIKPYFYYYVEGISDPNGTDWIYNGNSEYVWDGKTSSYFLKVGAAYKFYVNFNGETYMKIDTIKSANTKIVIEDNRYCNFP